MRVRLAVVLILLCSSSLVAQRAPEWERVYTFDDSIIEMNTLLVTFISKDITRARFRWTFDQPQTLPGAQKLTYKSQLEVLEFSCATQQYRPYHTTYFDVAGNMLRVDDAPGLWRHVSNGSMTQKLLAPACELIKDKTKVEVAPVDEADLENATRFTLTVARRLEQAKDFKIVIDQFFVAGYLNGYLADQNTSWFLNLNRDVAEKISRRELQRYYVALMNTGYLTSLYVISQLRSDADATEKIIPSDVVQLIRRHPYTVAYKRDDNFDFLAENIDSVPRLRSYTDLLERVSSLLRVHVRRVAAERSEQYQSLLADWDLYQTKVRICPHTCFGLPPGTKLFEVNVPVFRLQLAKVGGRMRVVSAGSSF